LGQAAARADGDELESRGGAGAVRAPAKGEGCGGVRADQREHAPVVQVGGGRDLRADLRRRGGGAAAVGGAVSYRALRGAGEAGVEPAGRRRGGGGARG